LKIAHIVPCRDKAKNLKLAVSSVLNQTRKVDVIFSDQGSKDETLKLLKQYTKEDAGKNNIQILECPLTDPKGMYGLNTHMDWIIGNTDYDLYIMTAADDWAHPERNEKVIAAYEKYKPDVVLTSMQFINDDGTVGGITIHPENDGFLDPLYCLEKLIGGSTSHAWTKEFWQFASPLDPISSYDGYLVFLATLRKGAYMINEPLHAYVRHKDINNTGLEGVYRASDAVGQKQIEELMHFQVLAGFVTALQKFEQWGIENQAAKVAIYEQIIGRAVSWAKSRTELTVQRIRPQSLKA
jgi:glycosyltransferase involved in cell wall biosynthesis